MTTVTTEPIDVTDASFKDDVLGSEVPVLVDFWAEWCPPCRMIAPVLKEIAAEYAGKLTIAKIDYDANPEVPAQHGVLGLPTLLLFKNGEVVEKLVGARPKRALLKSITPHL